MNSTPILSRLPEPQILNRYLLAGILLLYTFLSLYQINLPGLHYDEAFEAVPALQILLGQPVTAFRDSGIAWGQQIIIPFMTQDYIGAMNTYIAIPLMAIFGSTPTALRLMTIIVGGITLWLVYQVGYTLTQQAKVGLAAALLLAVDPTFIFWNRQGIFVTSITAMLALAATLAWLRYWQTRLTPKAIAGSFLLGLGLYAKFLFLWFIGALLGTIILLHPDWLLKPKIGLKHLWRTHKKISLGSGLAFLAGCWPLIAYNLQTGGTFLNITQNAHTSYYGVNNLAFGSNLVERLYQFGMILNGSHLWYLGDVINNPLPFLFFGMVLLGIIFMTIRNKNFLKQHPSSIFISIFRSPAQIAFFPYLIIGLVILASIATVSALWVTHFAVLMPWPALATAVGGWFILSNGPKFSITKSDRNPARPPYWLAWIGLSLLVITNLFSVTSYHQALAKSGGLSTHSDAIYDLSQWLAAEADGPVAAMDWGLAAPVTYLTHGQIAPQEIFGYTWQSDAALEERLESFIVQPDTLYLWRAPDEIIFDRSAVFKTLYRPLKLEETIEAAFYERSGRPILGVTRLVKCGQASNSPDGSPHCPK